MTRLNMGIGLAVEAFKTVRSEAIVATKFNIGVKNMG
jgi:hypothetical protein